jgi:hypothetical protein
LYLFHEQQPWLVEPKRLPYTLQFFGAFF